MAGNLSIYKVGIVFWALSILLVLVGTISLPGYNILSITLILTGITTSIMGGLALIYAEIAKNAK